MKIRVIDFETTAEKPPVSQVCEFGYTDIDDGVVAAMPISQLCCVDAIPPQSRAIHNIRPEWCKDAPVFDACCIDDGTADVFAAHNAEFEQLYLKTDKPWVCTYKVALRHWPDAPSHSNGALRYWLEDQGKITPDHALTQPVHRAGPDAYVTAYLLFALLAEGLSVETMIAWSKEPPVLLRCPLGKFRGQPWSAVESGFLGWMLKQPDMDPNLKWNAQRELDRRAAEQKPKLAQMWPTPAAQKTHEPS